MSDLVLFERRGSAALVTINRPDKRNALSRALIAELGDAFAAAEADAAVRSVIVTGSGPAFCAGMDLGELRGTLGEQRGMSMPEVKEAGGAGRETGDDHRQQMRQTALSAKPNRLTVGSAQPQGPVCRRP